MAERGWEQMRLAPSFTSSPAASPLPASSCPFQPSLYCRSASGKRRKESKSYKRLRALESITGVFGSSSDYFHALLASAGPCLIMGCSLRQTNAADEEGGKTLLG